MRQDLTFFIAAVLCAIIIGILGAFLAFKYWYVVDVQVVETRFEVIKERHIGFSLDTDTLSFGKVVPGGGAERKITFTTEIPAVMHAVFDPSLNGWVTIGKNDFFLPAGVEETIAFDLSVPKDALPGKYSGNVTLTYLRKLPW